jgi:hypothetical protein
VYEAHAARPQTVWPSVAKRVGVVFYIPVLRCIHILVVHAGVWSGRCVDLSRLGHAAGEKHKTLGPKVPFY